MKRVFGTKEWASSTVNILDGCQHNCVYCYARASSVSEDWSKAILKENAFQYDIGKRKGTIMYPSSHDIHPDNLILHLKILKKILESGNNVIIVSKPHLSCIMEICKEFLKFKNQILFRFTIGSVDDNVLKLWEPFAPTFEERLSSLKFAFDTGFKTSVSCEPMLDQNIHSVIENVEQYVSDYIWLGKANFLLDRLKKNGFVTDQKIMRKARELIEWQNDENIKELYNKFKENSKVKWKESIKKVMGIEIPTEPGLDI